MEHPVTQGGWNWQETLQVTDCLETTVDQIFAGSYHWRLWGIQNIHVSATEQCVIYCWFLGSSTWSRLSSQRRHTRHFQKTSCFSTGRNILSLGTYQTSLFEEPPIQLIPMSSLVVIVLVVVATSITSLVAAYRMRQCAIFSNEIDTSNETGNNIIPNHADTICFCRCLCVFDISGRNQDKSKPQINRYVPAECVSFNTILVIEMGYILGVGKEGTNNLKF